MKAQEIKKEIALLDEALKQKLISVNDFSTMYLTLSKKLKLSN
jgi:hypothetical protein